MSRIRSLLTLFVTATMLVLAACGGAPPSSAPTAAPAAEQATTAPAAEQATTAPAASTQAANLVIWNTGSEDDAAAMQIAADAFSAANPGVTINIEPLPWSDAYAKILAAVAGGVAPDMITGGMSWGIEFGKQGGMVDLKAAYPEMTDRLVDMLPPQVASAIIPPSGEVYALQLDVTMHQLYYRTDLVEQAPTTWEEFVAEIEQQRAAGNKGFQLDWGIADWLGAYPFIASAGGTFYDAACTQATINSPEAVQGVQFFADLFTKFNAPTDSVDIGNGLESGDYPMAVGGSWNAAGLVFNRPNIEGKWALAPLPAGPSGQAVSFLGGRVIGIMESSEHKDAAARFIEYLYTPEATKALSEYQLTKNNMYIPPSAELIPAAGLPQVVVPGTTAILESAGGPPNCTGWEAVQADVTKQIQEVIYNGADAQQAMDQAAELMNAALNP